MDGLQPPAKATIRLTGTHGEAAHSTQTGQNGTWQIPNVARGNYKVTAMATGYTMAPANQSVAVLDQDVAGVVFTATKRTRPAPPAGKPHPQ